MSYVDAHLHLADDEYAGQIEDVLKNAAENKVASLLSNGMDYESSIKTMNLARQYEGTVIAAVGIHPWTVMNTRKPIDFGAFERLVEENRQHIKAIGEIGLDGKYTQDDDKKKQQHEVFRSLLTLAERHTLPVVIHSRLAIDDVLATIPSFKLSRVLLHWYSGALEYLPRIRDHGYLISVGPSILYSKRSADIAFNADLSIVLTETDGPVNYFGPFKGKPTRPSFVIDVVRKLAEMKKKKVDEVRDVICNNYHSFLSLTK